MTGTKPTFTLSDSDVAKGSYFSVNWSLNEIPHHYEVWIDDPSPGLTPASSIHTVYSNTLSVLLANMHGKYRV